MSNLAKLLTLSVAAGALFVSTATSFACDTAEEARHLGGPVKAFTIEVETPGIGDFEFDFGDDDDYEDDDYDWDDDDWDDDDWDDDYDHEDEGPWY